MGVFTAGSVVVVNFPADRGRQVKRRPVLVLHKIDKEAFLACQIVSSFAPEDGRVPITDAGVGGQAYALPFMMITLPVEAVIDKLGQVSQQTLRQAYFGINFRLGRNLV